MSPCLAEMSAEVGCCLTEVENCFRLLVPLDFGPCPEASFLDEGPSGSLSSARAVPHWSSTPDDPDEPCCSKDLPAPAHHLGAAGAGGRPPQAATQGTAEDEDEHSDREQFVRSHGLGSHQYSLDVELPLGEGCQACWHLPHTGPQPW